MRAAFLIGFLILLDPVRCIQILHEKGLIKLQTENRVNISLVLSASGCSALALNLESKLSDLQFRTSAVCSGKALKVSLEQQTEEGAAKALAALVYEERCEVQQFSEPASAITFLAHGATDGVPFPPPGVALLIVRSSCPSNTSLSVQVLNRRALARNRDRRLLQAPATAPAPAPIRNTSLSVPSYGLPVASMVRATVPAPAGAPSAGSLPGFPVAAAAAHPGLYTLGNKSVAGNTSSGTLLLTSNLPDTVLPPVMVPAPTATVQCCCYNSSYPGSSVFNTPGYGSGCCCGDQIGCCPSTGLAICKGRGNYCFIIVTVSSVVVAFAFCLGFATFYAARVLRQRARMAAAQEAARRAVEMVPKKTVEQSLDTEGIVRECPVCWDNVTQNVKWALFSCRHGTCETCYQRIVTLPGSAASCPLCRMPLVEPRPSTAPASPPGASLPVAAS